jgi:hypothetical protein
MREIKEPSSAAIELFRNVSHSGHNQNHGDSNGNDDRDYIVSIFFQ